MPIGLRDRGLGRAPENLAKLNEEDPLPKMIEGRAIDVTPSSGTALIRCYAPGVETPRQIGAEREKTRG